MKTIKLLVILVLSILILPLLGYMGWLVKKSVPLELILINKSYRSYQGSENESLNYILNEKKVFSLGGTPYDLSTDYLGIFWNKNEYLVKFPRLKDIDRLVEEADFVYYSDVAGIYASDIRELGKDENDVFEYGGLNNSDYIFIKKLIESDVPLVLENSFFNAPADELVRYNLEKHTGVYYNGWIGKYVKNLELALDEMNEINLLGMYVLSTGNAWDYSGSGVVLVNKENQSVVVLVEGDDINTSDGFIVTDGVLADLYGVSEAVNYDGWFSVLYEGDNELVSEFQLNPTKNGIEKLNSAGLSPSFPALIRVEENCYFMAGDYGKNNINGMLTKVLVINKIKDSILGGGKSPSKFFFSYYLPFMSHIIDQSEEMREESHRK